MYLDLCSQKQLYMGKKPLNVVGDCGQLVIPAAKAAAWRILPQGFMSLTSEPVKWQQSVNIKIKLTLSLVNKAKKFLLIILKIIVYD